MASSTHTVSTQPSIAKRLFSGIARVATSFTSSLQIAEDLRKLSTVSDAELNALGTDRSTEIRRIVDTKL
ncbi:MAG: hypothetical protein OXC60_11620 [Litoreibacter sp.]|nr:hypothetical protein [Litoreibacter sp.]MCY4335301.1 hypothetical protein [Litoreibacter sp.]